MSDFGSPVAGGNTYNPNQGMQTLASIYGIKQAQAQLQNTQAQLPGIQAQSQLEQQNAQQQAAVANYFKNIKPQEHTGPDGTVDMDAAVTNPEFGKLGSAAPTVLKALLDIKQGQISNIQSLSNLNKDLRDQYNGVVGSLLSDKDVQQGNATGFQKVRDQISALEETNPAIKPVADRYLQTLNNVPTGDKDPTALAHYTLMMQQQGMTAESQYAAQQPKPLDVGGNITDIATGSPSGKIGGFSNMPKGLTPEQQIAYQTSLKGAQAQTEANFANINANRTAASTAPQQLDQINKALDLSSQVSTGFGTGERAKLESGISALIPGFDKLQSDSAKVQELNKFLARITTDSEKVLGANAQTDASRDAIAQQNASIGYAPQAIQNVLRYAAAQTMAMQEKGNAQEKWLKQPGNTITNQNEFETKWRQAYDPVIFQLEEAKTDSERQKIISGLSTEERNSLRQKRAQLSELGANITP